MATATTCCSMQRTAKSSRSSSSIEDLNSVYGRCLAKSLIKLCDDDCSRSTTPERERVRRREREKRRWRRSKVAPAEVIRLSGCGCGCGSLPDCKMAVLPAASAAPAAAAGALSLFSASSALCSPLPHWLLRWLLHWLLGWHLKNALRLQFCVPFVCILCIYINL